MNIHMYISYCVEVPQAREKEREREKARARDREREGERGKVV